LERAGLIIGSVEHAQDVYGMSSNSFDASECGEHITDLALELHCVDVSLMTASWLSQVPKLSVRVLLLQSSVDALRLGTKLGYALGYEAFTTHEAHTEKMCPWKKKKTCDCALHDNCLKCGAIGVKELAVRLHERHFRYTWGTFEFLFLEFDGDGVCRGRLFHLRMTPAGVFIYEAWHTPQNRSF